MIVWVSGAARRQVTFFCFAKRRVTKEKATPLRRPTGSFGLTGKLGVCATRPNSPHKTRAVAELKQGAADGPQSACQPEAAQKGKLVVV